MFIGHFAVGLAAKKLDPSPSLGVYFAAVQFLDLLWPLFLLLGLENARIEVGATELVPFDFYHYPYSHSLMMALIWALGAFFTGLFFYRQKRAALLIGICVFSHWLLDFLVHRPDLPLTLKNDLHVGLGWWNIPVLAIGAELLLFVAGIYCYLKASRPISRIGTYSFLVLILFLVFIWIGNFLGPRPQSIVDVAIVGNLQWLFVAWAFWVDRNRQVRQ